MGSSSSKSKKSTSSYKQPVKQQGFQQKQWGDFNHSSYANSHVIIRYGNYIEKILVDSGAGNSYISKDRLQFIKTNAGKYVKHCSYYKLPQTIANTTRLGECTIEFQLDNFVFTENFYIVNQSNLLGQTFIKRFIKTIDYNNKCITLNNKSVINILHGQLLTKDILCIKIGTKYHFGIIDTGACANMISKKHLQSMQTSIKKIKKLDDKSVRNMDNIIKCEFIVSLSFLINGSVRFVDDFYIQDSDKPYIIIGMDFIKKYITQNDIKNKVMITQSGNKIYYIHV